MNSPTHSLVALALLTRTGEKRRNWAVFIGSLIPDAFIYLCWLWLTFIRNEPQRKIWDEIYFNPPMQLTASVFNSIPIYSLLLAIGFWQRQRIWGKLSMFFAAAALLHIAFDFPVHAHDAHAHFWPFSNWKFHSPFSYWEMHLHAKWVGLFEALIGLASIAVLWNRFRRPVVKLLLVILAMSYAVLTIVRMSF